MIKSYDETDIQVLKGLDAVKKRPGMYIGNTDDGSGLHQMVFEIIANSLDEHMEGHCNLITVSLEKGNIISIKDNGRGIPTAIHPEERKPTVEVVMTTLHAGGKFDNSSYAMSGGLHGVGLSCVNALSEFLEVKITRSDSKYYQRFEHGAPMMPESSSCKNVGYTGTKVKFRPSDLYFTPSLLESQVVKDKLQELAYLNPKLTLIFNDVDGTSNTYQENDGIMSLILPNKDDEQYIAHAHFAEKCDNYHFDIGIVWRKTDKSSVYSYCNNIIQNEGGAHVVGMRQGIYRAIKDYTQQIDQWNSWHNLIKSEDTKGGISVAISVNLPDPKFSSQTKDKLINTEVRTATSHFVHDKLLRFLLEQKTIATAILEHIVLSYKGRKAAEEARLLSYKISPINTIANLPGTLTPCQTSDPDKAELFIVEGMSAGGSAKQARDRFNQAVLPLRGKILNVFRTSVEHVYSSEQVVNVFSALRVKNLLEPNIDSIPYHKIIVMADGDVDGKHFGCLLMTMFYKYLKPVIERGWLYIAQPPLYSITKGQKEYYMRSDHDLEKFLSVAGSKNSTIDGDDLSDIMTKYVDYKKASNNFFLPNEAQKLIAKGTTSLKEIYEHSLKDLGTHRINDQQQVVDMASGFIYQEDILWSRYCDSIRGFYRYKGTLTHPITVKTGDDQQQFDNLESLRCFLHKKASSTVKVHRYKGLGEMNSGQLALTTMAINTRHIVQVSMNDAIEAEDTFNRLMGKDVESRRHFIVENSSNFSLEKFE